MQTFTFEGEPDQVTLGTLWFEDLGDGRTRLRTQSLAGRRSLVCLRQGHEPP